jgi:hypothetical protein
MAYFYYLLKICLFWGKYFAIECFQLYSEFLLSNSNKIMKELTMRGMMSSNSKKDYRRLPPDFAPYTPEQIIWSRPKESPLNMRSAANKQ